MPHYYINPLIGVTSAVYDSYNTHVSSYTNHIASRVTFIHCLIKRKMHDCCTQYGEFARK
jgi:hypothetical protein